MKFLLVLLVTLTASADSPLVPKDFAFGYEVVPAPNQSFQRVEITQKIYQSTRQHDLSDIVVFNRASEVLPSKILVVPPKIIEEKSKPVKAKYFPIYVKSLSDLRSGRIKIDTRRDGAIIKVSYKHGKKWKNEISSYIIDASKIKNPIEAIILDLDLTQSQTLSVTVQGSQKLKSWSHVQTDILADLKFNDENLKKDRISIGNRNYKYYRVYWMDPSVQAKSIQLQFGKIKIQDQKDIQWKNSLHLKREDQTFIYDTGGSFPTREIQIELAEKNSFVKFKWESSTNPTGPWVYRGSKQFYKIVRNGNPLENSSLKVSARRDRYWRATLIGSPDGIGKSVPEFKIGWRPEEILFLSRGRGPFVLAFGSADSSYKSNFQFETNLTKSTSKLHSLGKSFSLGGLSKLTSQADPRIKWTQWVLWGILFFAVACLGMMALHLFKTLKQEN